MGVFLITDKNLYCYSKLRLISVVFLLFFKFGSAQNKADSLLKLAAASQNDSVRVKLMNDAVWELMFTEKEKSFQIAKKALDIAGNSKNLYSLSDCYNTLGVYYYLKADFQTSIKYHQNSMEVRTKLNDTKGLISTYNNIGSALKELGNYKSEVEYYFKALKISESKRDTISQCSILNNIADAFKRQDNYSKAEYYHLIVLELRNSIGEVKGLIATYINLGAINDHKKKFKEANKYYKQAGELLKTNPDNYLLAKYHSNLGSLLKDENKLEEAIQHINEAILINEKIGSSSSNLVNFVNLGTVFHEQKDFKKANEAYRKAYDLSIGFANKQWQKQALQGLSSTFAELNNFEMAFDTRLKYDELNDTLKSGELNKLLAETETKYRVEKKDVEIKLLNEKNKNSELHLKQRTLIILGLLVFILLLGIIGYFVRSKNSIRQKLETERVIKETEETERIRIAKDIHDELGSGLSKIKFLADLANANDKNKTSTLHSISDTSKHLVENMRDLIWAMNPENTSLDNLVARIRECASDYLEEFPIELNIDFPDNFQDLSITKEASRNILMIVKESLQNIIKHANATHVRLKMCINTQLTIWIEDNGEGFDPETENSGNGIKNMKNRMRNIGGKFLYVSSKGNGSKMEIEVALKNIEKLKILLNG